MHRPTRTNVIVCCLISGSMVSLGARHYKRRLPWDELFLTCDICEFRNSCLWLLVRRHLSLVSVPVSTVAKMTTDSCRTVFRGGRADSWPATTSVLTNPTAATTIQLEFIRPVVASCEAVGEVDEAV